MREIEHLAINFFMISALSTKTRHSRKIFPQVVCNLPNLRKFLFSTAKVSRYNYGEFFQNC